MSLPTRERGLKLLKAIGLLSTEMSLPTRERGLNLFQVKKVKLPVYRRRNNPYYIVGKN